MLLAQKFCILGLWLLQNTNKKPMLEVEPTEQLQRMRVQDTGEGWCFVPYMCFDTDSWRWGQGYLTSENPLPPIHRRSGGGVLGNRMTSVSLKK